MFIVHEIARLLQRHMFCFVSLFAVKQFLTKVVVLSHPTLSFKLELFPSTFILCGLACQIRTFYSDAAINSTGSLGIDGLVQINVIQPTYGLSVKS